MKARLKKMILENFKGVTYAEYNLDSPLVRIFGMNARGKTTIATAWCWLMFDKDYELSSNPAIRPLGVEECIPAVTATVDIDGKEYAFAKMQKRRVSKPDENGISKITLTNTYEVNSVPKTERDFKAYLEEKGIQLDNFLVCSHPDVFTGQNQKDMRPVLFKMSSGKSDLDIALMSPTTAAVAKELESHSMEEIEAMHKASKKKSDEEVNSIPDQIIGLEKAKVVIDVAELELAKAELKRKISAVSDKINSKSTVLEDLQGKDLDLQFKINAAYAKANDALIRERRQYQDGVDDAEQALRKSQSNFIDAERQISEKKEIIKHSEDRRLSLVSEYEAVAKEVFNAEKWKFDDSSKVCSLCGQELPQDKIAALLGEFEAKKATAEKEFAEKKKARLEEITTYGNKQKEVIDECNAEIEELTTSIKKYEADIADSKKRISEIGELKSALPNGPDLSRDLEYQKLLFEREEIKRQIAELPAIDNSELELEKVELETELNSVTEKLGQASNNIRIDEQIAELIEKKRDYEQKKADAEKILHQLSLVSKRKNSLLVDEINHHFSIVKWKLFDYAKNGEYKEVCVPYVEIGGKELEFNDSMNTGLKIRAKLDICNSFQKFFGVQYPVFLDNCESINTVNLPKMDTQLITLSVSDDKELRIEVTE